MNNQFPAFTSTYIIKDVPAVKVLYDLTHNVCDKPVQNNVDGARTYTGNPLKNKRTN